MTRYTETRLKPNAIDCGLQAMRDVVSCQSAGTMLDVPFFPNHSQNAERIALPHHQPKPLVQSKSPSRFSHYLSDTSTNLIYERCCGFSVQTGCLYTVTGSNLFLHTSDAFAPQFQSCVPYLYGRTVDISLGIGVFRRHRSGNSVS